MIASPQSFGDLIVHNPHLHAVVSLGLFRPDGVFLPLEDVDFSGLEKIFRERFFRMMLRREKVRPETVERMRAWEHSGFAVNFERKIEPYGRREQTGTRVSAKLRPDPSGSHRIERDSKASSRTWTAPPFLSAGSPTAQRMAWFTTRGRGHNFFFSEHQREHFHTVFRKRQLPADPTIYLVAASKTDSAVAPPGCDCLKILPHIPHIDDQHPLTRDDYLAFKERVVDKLERMGLKDLRRHVVFEHCWTPLDIRQQYYSNKGSIYGVVTDRFKNLAFKGLKESTKYPNLFFVGGSVNPGGGMPMVVLCGQNVAKMIVAWDRC